VLLEQKTLPLKFTEPNGAPYSYFVPPKEWELANPKQLSPRVKMGFIGSTKKELRPSVNLAIEPVDVNMTEYIAAVKKIHEGDPNNRWRDLGKFSTAAGEGRLTELESKSEWGNVRLLQLIVLKNKIAYIITASALKEEFSRFYQDFQSVFRTFTITSDLIGTVQNADQRQKLQKLSDNLVSRLKATSGESPENRFADAQFQKDDWIPFQNAVIQDFSEMGAYWQVLILQSIHEKLIKECL